MKLIVGESVPENVPAEVKIMTRKNVPKLIESR
jgi:hypothetical protein